MSAVLTALRNPISIHAPSWGRPFFIFSSDSISISIHAPSRGRRTNNEIINGSNPFQSTPPRGGDFTKISRNRGYGLFQSTPPRGGDYTASGDNIEAQLISIHAPSRGRRPPPGRWPPPYGRFQSTPPRGGDTVHLHAGCHRQDFNPRPLAGATAICSALYCLSSFQSTPPRGGDLPLWQQKEFDSYFNPRPLAGATATEIFFAARERFQSTPPRGGDIFEAIVASGLFTFQSTPPRGGDTDTQQPWAYVQDFNPRPLAGATWWGADLEPVRVISIHAPSRGRRC